MAQGVPLDIQLPSATWSSWSALHHNCLACRKGQRLALTQLLRYLLLPIHSPSTPFAPALFPVPCPSPQPLFPPPDDTHAVVGLDLYGRALPYDLYDNKQYGYDWRKVERRPLVLTDRSK